jgi:nicotinate-nucleotide adenylyltransferase
VRRIGLYGGMFDPVHLDDVRLVTDALLRMRLDEVILLPYDVAEDCTKTAPMRDRLNMLALAFAGIPGIKLAEERFRPGQQGLVDAAGKVIAGGDAELTLLMDAASLADFLNTCLTAPICDGCNLMIYPRRGVDHRNLVNEVTQHGFRILVPDIVPVACSDAVVRGQIGQLSDAPEMLSAAVAEYIALHGIYQPSYQKLLRRTMNERRYRHTLGVRDTAVRLARVHGISMQKAAVAGLLHDCAKPMKLTQMQAIAKKYRLNLSRSTLESDALLHGPVGAELARVRYQINDPDVLNAIRYHTVGRPGMTGLELCVYLADVIEPGRKAFPALNSIRVLAEKSLEEATLKAMLSARDYVLAKGERFCDDSLEAISDLHQKITVKRRNRNARKGFSPQDFKGTI